MVVIRLPLLPNYRSQVLQMKKPCPVSNPVVHCHIKYKSKQGPPHYFWPNPFYEPAEHSGNRSPCGLPPKKFQKLYHKPWGDYSNGKKTNRRHSLFLSASFERPHQPFLWSLEGPRGAKGGLFNRACNSRLKPCSESRTCFRSWFPMVHCLLLIWLSAILWSAFKAQGFTHPGAKGPVLFPLFQFTQILPECCVLRVRDVSVWTILSSEAC